MAVPFSFIPALTDMLPRMAFPVVSTPDWEKMLMPLPGPGAIP